MAAVLITYDLNRPGQDYPELYEAIESLGECWHELDSTWILATQLRPDQVMERLAEELDKSDSLLIIDITRATYQGLLSQKAWDWLARHVGP